MIDARLIIGVFLILSILPLETILPIKTHLMPTIKQKKRTKKKLLFPFKNDQKVLSYAQKKGVHIMLKEPANKDS